MSASIDGQNSMSANSIRTNARFDRDISISPAGSPLPRTATLEARRAMIVGDSSALGSIRDIACSIASRRCTVLVLGETGTGKELLARHIHAHSDRRDKPFVPVDCSALTESLFESQLFGHVRGAFTGAVRDSLGFIRSADTGTLFLDEVGELSPVVQAKLLRVIQERAVVPVGETRPRPVDIRVVCATHRDLRKMVADKLFREDLFFRLNVVTLHLPPLRERPQDILPLAKHFLELQAAMYDESVRDLADDVQRLLTNYPWPGNVRELANAIEHAHVLSSGNVIHLEQLPDRIRHTADNITSRPTTAIDLPENELCLEDVERRAIAEALRRTSYNKAAAARMLGINIQRLSRRIEKLNIEVPRGR
jgi:transcriptional regulator with PAS, ATPase and Fis domain